MKKQNYYLVDCNNFFVSCERVFQPKLEGKAVVVLSNNDGCIISRSEEAKNLGIKMGTPAFQINDLIKKHRVIVFSSNYMLYGDFSQRVMRCLQNFSADIEIYSIDEAFLLLPQEKSKKNSSGKSIAESVRQWTGIPVSVGVAETKTLAKAANFLVKKHFTNRSSFDFSTLSEKKKKDYLQLIPVDEIWGVGRQYSKMLQSLGISTALDLINAPESLIRKKMTVQGERIVKELKGIPCFSLEDAPQQKKAICNSRSFGKPLSEYADIEQATSSFATRCAEKLRQQSSCAKNLMVFLMTNRFAKGPHYVNSKIIELEVASNDTSEIIHYSRKLLASLYKKGYAYKKSGVIVSGIIPEDQVQLALFDEKNRSKIKQLTKTIDAINQENGRDKVFYAVNGTRKDWRMKQEKLSPFFTTKWSDLPIIQ